MSAKNSINNATQDLTIDSVAPTNSFIQLGINGTPEFIFGIDFANDSFRVSQGSSLGTNDTFIMNPPGDRTMPLQSAFLAKTTQVDNVTGDGTEYTVIWGAEVFDQNSDFNTGTGVFTAPISGRYFLVANIWSNNHATTTNSTVLKIVTSNRTYMTSIKLGVLVANATPPGMSSFVDMDASDTAHITYTVSGGTKVFSVSQSFCFFGGYLVC